MAKMYESASGITANPDPKVFQKLGDQLKQTVKKSLSDPSQSCSKVLKGIQSGLKKGAKGAMNKAFKIPEVMSFFEIDPSEIGKTISLIREATGYDDQIDKIARTLNISEDQVGIMRQFAIKARMNPKNLFGMMKKFQEEKKKGEDSELYKIGFTTKVLEKNGKGEVEQMITLLNLISQNGDNRESKRDLVEKIFKDPELFINAEGIFLKKEFTDQIIQYSYNKAMECGAKNINSQNLKEIDQRNREDFKNLVYNTILEDSSMNTNDQEALRILFKNDIKKNSDAFVNMREKLTVLGEMKNLQETGNKTLNGILLSLDNILAFLTNRKDILGTHKVRPRHSQGSHLTYDSEKIHIYNDENGNIMKEVISIS